MLIIISRSFLSQQKFNIILKMKLNSHQKIKGTWGSNYFDRCNEINSLNSYPKVQIYEPYLIKILPKISYLDILSILPQSYQKLHVSMPCIFHDYDFKEMFSL